jgi:hypothetical protein
VQRTARACLGDELGDRPRTVVAVAVIARFSTRAGLPHRSWASTLPSVPTPQQERAINSMLEAIPRGRRRVARAFLPLLMEHLANDELPRHLAVGRHATTSQQVVGMLVSRNPGRGDFGVLTVTKHRLVWVGGPSASRPRLVEVKPKDIIHASGNTVLSSGELTVALRGNTFNFTDMKPKGEGRAIEETLRSRNGDEFISFAGSQAAISMDSDSAATSHEEDAFVRDVSVTAADPDAFEHLRKLGELRDAGVLTDEEFAAKKAELLGRI